VDGADVAIGDREAARGVAADEDRLETERDGVTTGDTQDVALHIDAPIGRKRGVCSRHATRIS
jgi:hypothetical protein